MEGTVLDYGSVRLEGYVQVSIGSILETDSWKEQFLIGPFLRMLEILEGLMANRVVASASTDQIRSFIH